MSEGMDQPPEVYRRRRIAVAVIAVIVLVLLIVAITWVSGVMQERGRSDASAAETPTSKAFHNFSARPAPSVIPTSASPTPSGGMCSGSNLKVNVDVAKTQYAAGENPAITVTYTNTSDKPCQVGGEKPEEGVDITITSNGAPVYVKKQCAPQPQAKTDLTPGKEQKQEITWERKSASGGCDNQQDAEAGTYTVTAAVAGVQSQPMNFTLE